MLARAAGAPRRRNGLLLRTAAVIVGAMIGLSGVPGAACWLFIPAAIALAVYDARERRIPEAISIPTLLGILAASVAAGWHVALTVIGSGVVLGIVMFLLMWLVQRFVGEDALGFGDVVAVVLIGLALSDPRLFTPVEPLFAIGVGTGIGFVVETARGRAERIPMGFWLLLPAAALAILGLLGHTAHF
jgi:prepilin signal peptidase PulO-like enzyme (type II secretory pathway)